MTTDVTVQAAYVALTQPDLAVAGQTAYVVIIPGQRAAVASQSAYVVIRPQASAPASGRRSGRLRLGIGL